MTDATPQNPPAAASEPAKAATPGAAPVPASSLGGQRSPIDLLREHQSTIVVVLALIVAALAVVMIRKKQASDRDGRAWEELTNLRQSRTSGTSGTDGFSELAARYKGTSADPFIRIAWAARLYEGGKKDQVVEAKELLEQVLREHPGNPFVKNHVPLTLARYEEELKDPKVHWAPATTTAAAGPPEAPFPPAAGTEPPK